MAEFVNSGGQSRPASSGGCSDEALLERLVAAGALDSDARARLERLADGPDDHLWLAVRLGMVSERRVAALLAQELSLPLLERDDYVRVAEPAESTFALRFLRERRVLPMGRSDAGLQVAFADPRDSVARAALAFASGCDVHACVGVASEIEAAIERLQAGGTDEHGEEPGDPALIEDDVEHLRDLASEAPVIRRVNGFLRHAIEVGASDIHLECGETALRIRCRVDGVLRDIDRLPLREAAPLISRIKILAHLDIAERRLPQDGRLRTRVHGRRLDIRVSTLPAVYGEGVVLRLLDCDGPVPRVDALGFDDALVERMKALLAVPGGIMLVAGPTGSGKTTTLYAAIAHLRSEGTKIVTVEDPVEYQLEDMTQIQANAAIGLDFSDALRSILRHDPDIVLVGEIRDTITARIAIQAALTGHLVLSTLHAGSAVEAIPRLLDMGVERHLLATSLNAVLGQRLIRRLCRTCRPRQPRLPEAVACGPTVDDCRACGGAGYRGRAAIGELLVLDDEIRELVAAGAPAGRLTAAARANGMRSLHEDGAARYAAGETSEAELVRVTGAGVEAP